MVFFLTDQSIIAVDARTIAMIKGAVLDTWFKKSSNAVQYGSGTNYTIYLLGSENNNFVLPLGMFYRLDVDGYLLTEDKMNFSDVMETAWNNYIAIQGKSDNLAIHI